MDTLTVVDKAEASVEPPPAQGKILIVDDMQMHLETAELYLGIAGYEVYCANDTKTAWSLVNEKLPDVVLLDVVLGGENGLDLLSRIHTYQPQIEVIVMTAFGSEDVAATALKLGAAEYIRKPVKYGNLSRVVEKSLARKREAESREIAVKSLKHAYEELQVRAKTILHSMAAGVVAVDNQLLIRRINRQARCFLGKPQREVVGKPLYEMFPFLQGNGLLKRTLETGLGLRMNDVQLTVNGRDRTFFVRTDVMVGRGSNVIGAVAIFDDVTELRHMERTIKDRERLVVIGQMAAGIAHEIKNPLTAIKGFGQLLSSKNKDPELNKYLEIMMSEVNRINQVAQNFLELSKPKAPELVKISINEVLEDMNPIINSQTHNKNIMVEVETDDRIPAGLMDPCQIKQMLFNLVQNAVEAMEKGGDLRITTAYLPEQNQIRLDIEDTGCGIPADKIDKVGVPFHTTKPQGTGLGLSICHSIVDQYKGRIKVRSEVGWGTKFSVFLPIMS